MVRQIGIGKSISDVWKKFCSDLASLENHHSWNIWYLCLENLQFWSHKCQVVFLTTFCCQLQLTIWYLQCIKGEIPYCVLSSLWWVCKHFHSLRLKMTLCTEVRELSRLLVVKASNTGLVTYNLLFAWVK